jgi:hypothetical protein
MKTNIFFLVLILFVIGCASSERKNTKPDDGAIVIDVNSALKGEGRYLDEMVENVEVIPLETTKASILGDVVGCIVTDNSIFVNDIYENSDGLAMFDKNGKFIKRFNRGNGPDEYPSIDNICFVGGYLYVCSDEKILKYTEGGEFVESKMCDLMCSAITKVGDGFVMLQPDELNDERKFKIIRLDSNLTSIAEQSLERNRIFAPNGFNCFDGVNCLISRFADNNVYTCTDDAIKVKYRLDFSEVEYQIPFDKYENLPMEERYNALPMLVDDMDKDKYIFEGSFRNCEDYLIFHLLRQRYVETVYYNKNTGKTWKEKYREQPTPLSMVWGVGNAYMSGKKNVFCGAIHPQHMNYCWKNNPHNLFSNNDIEVLKNAKEEDNPIVVIYKLKDNL